MEHEQLESMNVQELEKLLEQLYKLNNIPEKNNLFWRKGYEQGKTEMREQIEHLMRYTILD